ncbi:MAG: DUF1365 domain-containing protein [Pseudomonadota bacterium]
MLQSGLYFGTVFHQRVKPRAHRLQYKVFSMLIDLDEASALSKSLRLFGHEKRAPISFLEADHGAGVSGGLRAWVDARLSDAGFDLPGGRVFLLCYPRIFGYVFNPISIYYCFDRTGALAALLYEVSNTYHEKHTYVIPVSEADGPTTRQACAKRMFVSPFTPMEGRYLFSVTQPGETLSVVINQHDTAGQLLVASFKARRRSFTDATLARALIAYPFMTLKVMAAIHWEALKLWMKGLQVFPHKPALQRFESSVIDTREPLR